jgi:two-component system chemotaxis response regulator CheB
MPAPSLITIGTSAGGLSALGRILPALDPGFPAPVIVVMHVGPSSLLPQLLDRRARLPVQAVADGAAPLPGNVYVAPPNHHVRLEGGRMVLSRGPRENGHRPSIDVLFRSAARAFRQGVVGVLLTGLLDDGVAGLFAIRARGGLAIVQDPLDAQADALPRSALRYVGADHVLPADAIGPLLNRLVEERRMDRRGEGRKARKGTKKKARATDEAPPGTRGRPGPAPRTRGASQSPPAPRPAGEASPDESADVPTDPGRLARSAAPLVCPECHGPLFAVDEGRLRHYRCIVGHAFSPESLTEAHTEALERALWIAGRTLQERVYLRRLMADRKHHHLSPEIAQKSKEAADAAERDLLLIREILDRL